MGVVLGLVGTDGRRQSFKVKSMYIEQLRNLDLVALRLLPSIIHLLRLDEGLNRAVKVETWAVDEFYIPCEFLRKSMSVG